jgi:D-glycero-D-manno-heptose 1,7-bisphosphate phosphatase
VFLDRDGTMIEDVGYLDAVDRIAFFPWTVDAIRSLNRAGFPVVVITNQSGIAREKFTEAFVNETHRLLSSRLEAGGARVEAYYYCPHHPEGTIAALARVCDCRKPGTALVERAAADFGLDLARSFMVGDRWLDVALGQAMGGRGILVRTGVGADQEASSTPDLTADAIVDNLIAAASYILSRTERFEGSRF